MLTCSDHPSEESLERYALGGLPAGETERLEEHLLVCAACQDLLTEVDIYVQAVRDAAIQLSHEQHLTWRQRLAAMLDVFMARRLVWVAGALLVAAGLTWMSAVRARSRPGLRSRPGPPPGCIAPQAA